MRRGRVVAGLLAVVVLGACGSSTPFPSAGPSTIPRPTPAQGTAANAVVIAGVRKTFAQRSARVTMDVSALPASSSHGTGVAKILGNASDVTTSASTQQDGKPVQYSVETRIVGDTLYLKVPRERAEAFGGNPKTPWIAANVRARRDAYVGLSNAIPIELVLALATTATLAERSPQRYIGQIDLLNALEKLPADVDAALAKAYGAVSVAPLVNLLGTTPDITVRIDEAGRVVEVALFTDGASRSLRVGLSDFSVDVTVVAPRAAEVSPAIPAGRPA